MNQKSIIVHYKTSQKNVTVKSLKNPPSCQTVFLSLSYTGFNHLKKTKKNVFRGDECHLDHPQDLSRSETYRSKGPSERDEVTETRDPSGRTDGPDRCHEKECFGCALGQWKWSVEGAGRRNERKMNMNVIGEKDLMKDY